MESNNSLPPRAAYGTWRSPIDAQLISESVSSLQRDIEAANARRKRIGSHR